MPMNPENTNSGHRRRLRERFAKSSLEGFHDYEALELLLTFAIPRRDVKPLAKEMLRRFKGLNGVLDATAEELQTVKGVGSNAAALVAIVKEAALAYLNETPTSAKTIRSAKDVIACLGEQLSSDEEDKLFAVYLSAKNDVLGIEAFCSDVLEKGGTAVKKVIAGALRFNARSVIFVHSRQSGAINPASAGTMERAIATELAAAASAIEVIVHDYIVACEDKHLSAYEMGWLRR